MFGIDDVEKIAAPNLMRIETANEYVDFTFWHKPGEGKGGVAPYDRPAVTCFLLFFGTGEVRGILRVALAIVIPAVYWSFGSAESQIASREATENKPQGSRVFSRWIQGEGEEEKFHVWGVRIVNGLCQFIARGAALQTCVPVFFPAVGRPIGQGV